MTDNVLAVDAGTTGITALVIDATGTLVAKAYREFPQYFPRPGWVEHDPNEIWAATQFVIQKAASQVGGLNNIRTIGITNQRETVVLWDRKTLQPVHNAIVWQCRRSAPICEELIESGLADEIRGSTGLVVDAYFSGTKLTWLFREIDGLRSKAESGALAFGTVDTWLMSKLSKGEIHATDPSNASRTLMYNISKRGWDDRLLSLLEVPPEVLPAVQPSSGRYGMAELDGTSIPIAGVAGDQQAALFGQACFEAGMSKNTYGTGSFVLTNIGESHTISSRGLLTSVAWEINNKTDYALEGSIFVTGAAIQWLRDGLGIIQDASETNALAESVEDTGGVYFVPALVGLGAPHWDPYARGTITGITRGTNRSHLVRAALEAMAYQTKDVIDAAYADSGIPLTELRVDGGASASDFLCQFQADLLGVAVSRPKVRETTALGAAYLAGLAESVWESKSDVSQNWKLDRTFEPVRSERYAELYEGWLEALERAKSTAHRP